MDDKSTHTDAPSDRANIVVLAVVLALVTTFFSLADNFLSGSEDTQPETVTAAIHAPR